MNQTIREHRFPTGQVLQLAQGDITDEKVDAIVNAANTHLAHGAGVAGAIVRKGGRLIQDESQQWVRKHGLVSHSEPAYTQAGNLPCKYVIHAVGPHWGEGDEQNKLKEAVTGALALAEQLSLGSISLPAISTGIFGFPKELAAQELLSAIRFYLSEHPASGLRLIRLVLFDLATMQAFLRVWEQDDQLGS
jgi:O-acetyl-ADP-ribose deacetylase (regulator of RNase III)